MADPIKEAVTDIEKDVKDVPTVISDVESGNIGGAVDVVAEDANALIPLVPQLITETKAGYKTTEFWFSLAAVIFDSLNIHGVETKEKAILSGVVAVYALTRGIAKHGVQSFIKRDPKVAKI